MQNRAEGDVDKIIRDRFFPAERAGVFVEVGLRGIARTLTK